MIYDLEVCAHERTYGAETVIDRWILDIEMLLGIEKIECRPDIAEDEQ